MTFLVEILRVVSRHYLILLASNMSICKSIFGFLKLEFKLCESTAFSPLVLFNPREGKALYLVPGTPCRRITCSSRRNVRNKVHTKWQPSFLYGQLSKRHVSKQSYSEDFLTTEGPSLYRVSFRHFPFCVTMAWSFTTDVSVACFCLLFLHSCTGVSIYSQRFACYWERSLPRKPWLLPCLLTAVHEACAVLGRKGRAGF